ncbi:MAG: hypothetical protein R6U04_04660 [Bacteroidales bacterium]
MKKLFLHIGIGIVIIIALNQLAIHSARVYKDGASIICEQKREAVRHNRWKIPDEKPTILFFGASEILSSVVPAVFDSTLNHSVYSLNMALPALPIGPYYHYLLDYLEQNAPPDYIVMTYHVDSEPILLFNSYANQGINFPREFVSYFLNRKDKNQVVNYLLPFHVYRNAIFEFISTSIFNPEDINQTKENNREIVDRMIDARGYYFIREQARFPEGRLPEDYSKETDCPDCEMVIYDPDGDVFVDKFFKLTGELDIQVLLIPYPVREGTYKQFDTVPEIIRKLENKFSHVSLPKKGWKIPFYENRYFADPYHLNQEGAEKFSIQTAEHFREIFYTDFTSELEDNEKEENE